MKTRPLARRSMFVGLGALLAVALLASACSSSKKASSAGNGAATTTGSAPTTSSGGAGSASGTLVHVKNFAFDPGTVTVSVGSKVTWEFDDSVSHNVTASDKSFSSSDLNSGKKFTFTFNKAGSFTYTCTIHPQMKAATVVVK